MNLNKEKNIRKIISFILPCFLFLIISAFIRIYPFGDNSILTIDMKNQYVSFFIY